MVLWIVGGVILYLSVGVGVVQAAKKLNKKDPLDEWDIVGLMVAFWPVVLFAFGLVYLCYLFYRLPFLVVKTVRRVLKRA